MTFSIIPRHVDVHPVMASELDDLRSEGPDLPLTFFGISFGVWATVAVVLLSQKASDPGHATFTAMFWIGTLPVVFFAARSIRSWIKRRRKINEIKARPTTAVPVQVP